MLTPYATTRGAVPRIAEDVAAGLIQLGHTIEMHEWGRRSDTETLISKVLGRPLDAVQLGRWVRESAPDVVYMHTGFDRRTLPRDALLLGLAGRRACRIIQLHGGRTDILETRGAPIFKFLAARLMRQCDAIFALSSEEVRCLDAFGARRARLVKNPLARDFESVVMSEGDGSVLFAGRLVREKGIFELVEAWACVPKGLRTTLIVAGDGPYGAQMGELAQQLGVGASIEFVGHADDAQMHALYARSSVFVLPSHSEGFPTVLAEAMAYGLPIITTPIRGARDRLIEEENCVFVRPGDSADIARGITLLLTDEELRQRMGSMNRQCVRQFSREIVVEEIEREILSACAERKLRDNNG